MSGWGALDGGNAKKLPMLAMNMNMLKNTPTAGIEEEEQMRELQLACATVPENVNFDVKKSGNSVTTILSVSHASAFELVRQALAACPGVDEINPLALIIRNYVHEMGESRGESNSTARMNQLADIIGKWTGIELEIHKKVKKNVKGGNDAINDALAFAIVVGALVTAVNPFTVVLAGLTIPAVLINRISHGLAEMEQRKMSDEETRKWLLEMSREDLVKFEGGGMSSRWDDNHLRNLFRSIEKLMTDAFTKKYSGEDGETVYSFEFKYNDLLTVDTVKQMRMRANSFFATLQNKSGKEQRGKSRY